VHVREATEEEASPWRQPGYETIVLILEDAGAAVGHGCISFGLGSAFGHDWHVESGDAAGATMLLFRARRILRDRGQAQLFIHQQAGEPSSTAEFWRRVGATEYATVYRWEL